MNPEKTLDDLRAGENGVISAIGGNDPMAQRLMALGLLEGSRVEIMRKALGGDPIEVEVMGYALSLRRAEAKRITVEAGNGI
jgi:ferrous iron transport protein A